MSETFELRIKPEPKIKLDADGFEIIDVSEPKNNGTYSYGQLKSVELNAERTNLPISVISWIAEIFTSSAVGGNFKTKANLQLVMINKTLKIWLIIADFKKAERVTELIKNKKTYTQQNL